uniref:ATP synthase F0 subunit 8 n=1 Tax=Solenaia carinata TaxID=1903492 RepID=V9NEI9_9BIVA|nr:ATP synthase F0 subunit 8 [Solenaia carinata]
MPQFSPMSWVFIGLFLVSLILVIGTGVWWVSCNYYAYMHAIRRSRISRLFGWGKSVKK